MVQGNGGVGLLGRNFIRTHAVLAMLNRLVQLDRPVIERLIEQRVVVNEELATDQSRATLYVVTWEDKPGDPPQLGLLGVLNGIVGEAGLKLYAIYEDDQKTLTGFRLGPRLTGKEATGEQPAVQSGCGPELREEVPGDPACRRPGG